MTKIKNIEFLRLYLILAVVLIHMFIDRKWCLCTLYPDITLYQNIKSALAHSNNSVDGFFIISGFLFGLTFKLSNFKDFVIKKYIRLSPAIAFSILLCFGASLIGAMHFDVISNLLTIGLVNQFGIKITVGQNPVLWYTSVLFAGSILYFCILKYCVKKWQSPLILGLCAVSYTILEILQHGSFANPIKNYYHIFNIGFLRAVGGIGTGIVIFNLTNKLKNLKDSILYSFGEIFSLICFFWWMTFSHKNINNIIFVLLFSIILFLFVIKKGVVSKFLNKDIWVFWGRYQYSIYVVHYVIIRVLGLCVWKNQPEFVNLHPILPIFITLLAIIPFGLFTYYVVELPCAKYLKKKLYG